MFIFQSMIHISIFIALTVYFLLLMSLRNNPFYAAGMFVQELFAAKKYLLHFTAMTAILFLNKMEVALENRMILQKLLPLFCT